MKAVWAKILRTLREQKQVALFALVSTLDDVELTDTQIIISAHNAAEYQMLKKYWPELKALTEQDCLVLVDRTVTVNDVNVAYVEKLKELFGDKVEIV